MRILAPMVVFTVISGISTGILQAHRYFTAPAISWLAYNFGIIGGAFIGGLMINQHPGDPAGLQTVGYGVLVGAVLLVAVQAPALVRRGFRLRPSLNLRHPAVVEILLLFIPYMLSLAATQICLLSLPNIFASFFDGGVASMRFANRLVILPYSLFGSPSRPRPSPTMAERVAAGEVGEFRKLVSGLCVWCSSSPSPPRPPSWCWRRPCCGCCGDTASSMSPREDVVLRAALLRRLAGRPVRAPDHEPRVLLLKDRVTVLLVSLGYTTFIAALSVALIRLHSPLKYAANPAATSLGTIVGLLAMLWLLRRKIGGIDGREIGLSVLRVCVASAVMAAAMWAVVKRVGGMLHVPATQFVFSAPSAHAVSDPVGPIGSTAATGLLVLACMGIGIVVYVIVLKLLRAPELSTVAETIRRRRSSQAVETA